MNRKNDVDIHNDPEHLILPLIIKIKDLINTVRITAVHNINILQVRTNFEIGRLIGEYEQGCSERAGYGKQTLPELSKRLTTEFGSEYSRSNLENMSRFYIEYQKKPDQISQTLSGNLPVMSLKESQIYRRKNRIRSAGTKIEGDAPC